MTELNPRAWSIDGECWCTRVDYDGHKKEWSGIAPVLAPDNRSKRIGEIEDTNIIVESPTGLKDKNDKKIYIGDVVSEHHGDFVGEIVQKPSGEYRIAWVGIFGGESVLYGHHLLCEVIGNIHENPELIEEKKRMSIEITDELAELVEEHKHYGTEATARHLAAYICDELNKEEKE